MTRIIEKRRSLHNEISKKKKENSKLQLQVGQLQALANVGVSTFMIAHEINNLLTPIGNYAALALQHPDDKALGEKALTKVTENCSRVSKVMESMLALVNGEAQEKKDVLLLGQIEGVFSCLCRDFSKDSIKVILEVAPELTVRAVPVEIQQVLMNLILNARDSMLSNGGVLKISAHKDSDSVCIILSDTGCGISEEDMEKIFEPFFSTKVKSEASVYSSGSGLGLSFCKKIVEEHNGSISVDSEVNAGTTFTIQLPVK